jgi:hypothetical protein
MIVVEHEYAVPIASESSDAAHPERRVGAVVPLIEALDST